MKGILKQSKSILPRTGLGISESRVIVQND